MAGLITLDTQDLRNFGVLAIRGSYDDFVKLPNLKQPSLYSWVNEDNDDVDLSERMIEASDVTLTFLMSAFSIRDLMEFREGLLALLTEPGYRTLYIATLNKTFQIYYKGCESASFIRGYKLRIKMVLKFRMNN